MPLLVQLSEHLNFCMRKILIQPKKSDTCSSNAQNSDQTSRSPMINPVCQPKIACKPTLTKVENTHIFEDFRVTFRLKYHHDGKLDEK